MSKVTACVPVYNGASFVQQTLDSLRSQTYQDWQCIISVDRSDDDSAAICRAFAGDPRVQLTEQPTRLGLAKNVEFLLRRAHTEYVFVLPHDDILENRYIETLLRHMKEHPQAIVAYCDISRFGSAEGVIVQPSVVGSRMDRIIAFVREHNNAVAFRGLMRANLIPIPPALPHNPCEGFATDTAWVLSLVCRGELHRVEDSLYRKRIHDGSQLRRWLRHEKRWHREAWLEHCLSCARVAFEYVREDGDVDPLLEALRYRLTMIEKDLWPPSEMMSITPTERRTMIRRFRERLAEFVAEPALGALCGWPDDE